MHSAEALALEAQAGSVQAFEALVARFEAPLHRFLWMRTRDAAAAEDLTQDSFLRAWQNLARYDPRWRFSTWLYTLAERLCISARRSRGKDPAVTGGEIELGNVPAGHDPAQAAAERDEGRALWETAFRVLRPEERSALWLRYAEDLSMEEIGAVLGRPAVTVRVLLFRARGRLGAALEPRAGVAARPADCRDQPALAEEGLGGLP
ncbi:MAG: sigma-70 family RNA polymerase sigma factor [Planctomycetes bacterium]|nr:sigma-70 family RNA polymerase sigma factor [Planctomycetota bacterium]